MSGGGVASRLSTLQVGCPYPLEVMAFIPDMDEAKVRKQFEHLKARGEWHTLTAEVLAFISGVKHRER
jgi:hypothetical protein